MTIRLSLPRRRWVRVTLWVVLIVLAAAGLWWWRQPHPFHLVAVVPGYSAIACTSGFLVEEARAKGGCDFVLHDWATGAERWRVPAPWYVPVTPSYEARTALDAKTHLFRKAMSPDGRILAVLDAYQGHVRLRSWRDGQPVADLPLPHPAGQMGYTLAEYGVRVLDDGRVLAWMPEKAGYRLVNVRERELVAQGCIAFTQNIPLITGRINWYTNMSADGQLFWHRFMVQVRRKGYTSKRSIQECLQVSWEGSQLATYPSSGTGWFADYGMLADGITVNERGVAFFPDGHARSLTTKGFFVHNARYLASISSDPPMMLVECPATGDLWQVPMAGEWGPLDGFYIYPDGRLSSIGMSGRNFAVIDISTEGKYLLAFRTVGVGLKAFPMKMEEAFRDYVPECSVKDYFEEQSTYLVEYQLYERPGKLRAVINSVTLQRLHSRFPDAGGDSLRLSPDGRALLFFNSNNDYGKAGCLLFRW